MVTAVGLNTFHLTKTVQSTDPDIELGVQVHYKSRLLGSVFAKNKSPWFQIENWNNSKIGLGQGFGMRNKFYKILWIEPIK